MRGLVRREPENAVVRWKPFREMEQFRREMDELFGRFFDWRPTPLATPTEFEFTPALDVYETPDEFVVFVTCARRVGEGLACGVVQRHADSDGRAQGVD
jgi:hypothetical protein